MRRAARIDANQPAITAALRAIGCHVQPLHTVGKGCPDLLVSYRGAWFVMELKDGAKSPSRRLLTPDEEAWHAAARAPVHVVASVHEALTAVGAKAKVAA